MALAYQYATNNSPQVSDIVLTYVSNSADTRKLSLGLLSSFVQSQMAAPGTFAKQYYAPNATGFSVTISPIANGASTWLLMTPLAGYAAGTITLPASSLMIDGQLILVTTTQAVTTLTVDGNGAAVNGAPATLAANSFFTLSYDKVTSSYYRVG